MVPWRSMLGFVVASFGITQVAWAGSYTYQSFAFPDPSAINYTVTSFNDSDQVLGFLKNIPIGSPGHDPDPNANFIAQGAVFTNFNSSLPHFPTGINDAARLIGYTPVPNSFPGDVSALATGGKAADATYTFPGSVVNTGLAISNNGNILGTYDDFSGKFIFVNGAYSSINSTPVGSNGAYSDINNAGQVSGTDSNGVPFLYSAGVYTSRPGKSPGKAGLNDFGVLATDFFDPNLPSSLNGYQIVDVNDRGQFLGTDSGGYFIATPVPEPSTLVLLGVALTVFGTSRFGSSRKGIGLERPARP